MLDYISLVSGIPKFVNICNERWHSCKIFWRGVKIEHPLWGNEQHSSSFIHYGRISWNMFSSANIEPFNNFHEETGVWLTSPLYNMNSNVGFSLGQ